VPPLHIWLLGAQDRLAPLAAALAARDLDPAPPAPPADIPARGPVVVDLEDPAALAWLAAAPPGARPRLGWGAAGAAAMVGEAVDLGLPPDPAAAAEAAAAWLAGPGPVAAAARRWSRRLLAAPNLERMVAVVAEAALEVPGVVGALAVAPRLGGPGPGGSEPVPPEGAPAESTAGEPSALEPAPAVAEAAGDAALRLPTPATRAAAAAALLAGRLPLEFGNVPARLLALGPTGDALLVLLDPAAGPSGNPPLDEPHADALAGLAGLALASARCEEGLRASLTAAELHIQALEQTRSALLANVSHEIRTPLVSIKGYSELVLKERVGPVNETQREFLSIVLANVSRLVALVDNLLVYSSLHQGGQRLVRERLDLREVIEDAIALLRPAADARGVRFEARLGDAPVEMRGDRRKLGLVFANVLSNAVKFNRSGGRVSVEVTQAPEDPARMVAVSVADTGIGIPAAALGRVFEQFYQVDGGFTRRYGGAGLGLSIVKDLVTRHGGDVRVSSAEGEGTTVVVTFPRSLRRPGPRALGRVPAGRR
jgi:signal transduction histidine kinase